MVNIATSSLGASVTRLYSSRQRLRTVRGQRSCRECR